MVGVIDRCFSKAKWWFDSSPGRATIDLDSVCEFIDASENPDVSTFKSQGIVVVRNLMSSEKIAKWSSIIEKELRVDAYSKKLGKQEYWMASIGDIPDLVETTCDPGVLAKVEALIGKDRKFVGHDSVTINYSVPGHHDDQNSHKDLYSIDDYPDNFSTIRTLFYLSDRCSAPQRFGFVPGSHRRNSLDIDYSYAKDNTVWIEVSHGTMIFFDPRLVHTASPLNHTKRMIVGTYDLENDYTQKIFQYTAVNRGQGTQADNEEFWSELSNYNLKPGFV